MGPHAPNQPHPLGLGVWHTRAARARARFYACGVAVGPRKYLGTIKWYNNKREIVCCETYDVCICVYIYVYGDSGRCALVMRVYIRVCSPGNGACPLPRYDILLDI